MKVGAKMNFSVRELLRTETLKNAKILAGKSGIDNEIKGVTIIEAPDIVKFIKGGEVLLTGLYAFKSCSIETFKGYFRELTQKNVSALILKRGRNVEFADNKIDLLMEFAEAYSIPVLEVPFEVSFREIMSIIMEHIFNEEVARLKYFKTTHDNFSALLFSLNSTENEIKRILEVLSKLIHNPVSIFNQNMKCLETTSDEILNLDIGDNSEIYEVGFYSNNTYLKQKITIKGEIRNQYLIFLNITLGVKLYLVITEINKILDIMDFIAIENAITALYHEYSRQYAINELEKKFQNDIMHNLLNGKIHSVDQLQKSLNILGIKSEGNYRAIVLGFKNEEESYLDFNKKTQHTNILNDAIFMYFVNARIQNDLDRVIVIQEINLDQKQEEYRKEIKIIVEKIQKYIERHNNDLKVKVGIGNVVDGIINISRSFREANDAFNFVDVANEISSIGSEIILFSDLGIFKLLCKINDTAELLEYVPESLQKLYNYKKNMRDDLLLTLKAYLDRNQNLKRAADDLYIHYKTAAYRMDKISNITGIDFNNPSEVLAVRIGLIVYKMIEKHNKNLI